MSSLRSSISASSSNDSASSTSTVSGEQKTLISSKSSLLLQSSPILAHINSFLSDDLKAQNAAAQTAKYLHFFYQPTLRFKRLLYCVAYNQVDEAKKIIAFDPKSFLTRRDTVTAPNGDIIENVTPVELAWTVNNTTMCYMMRPYLDKMPEIKTQVLRDFQVRFPELFSKEKEEKLYDFTSLFRIFDNNIYYFYSINKDNIIPALHTFKDHFKPRIIKNGKQFCIKDMLTAMRISIQKLNQPIQYAEEEYCNERIAKYWWSNVVKYLLKKLPIFYAHRMQDLTLENTNNLELNYTTFEKRINELDKLDKDFIAFLNKPVLSIKPSPVAAFEPEPNDDNSDLPSRSTKRIRIGL